MEKKYLPVLIGFCISVTLFITIYLLHFIGGIIGASLIPSEYIFIFIPVIPGPMITDVILLYAFPIAIYLIIYLISPYLIQVLYHVNKLTYIFRQKPDYGLLEIGQILKPTRVFSRVVLVTLFSFGTSALLVQIPGFAELFRASPPGMPDIPNELYIAEAIFFATMLISSISFFLFLPVWLLEDSGLVAYRHFPDQRRTPIIEGIHRFYSNILGAYTGISTILVLIQVIGQIFPVLEINDPAILTPIILILLPLILTGLLAMPLFIYERQLSKAKVKIHTKLRKYNLPYFQIPNFNELIKGEE